MFARECVRLLVYHLCPFFMSCVDTRILVAVYALCICAMRDDDDDFRVLFTKKHIVIGQ